MSPWPPKTWQQAQQEPPTSGPYYFNPERAGRVIKFVRRYCSHNKGQWSGQSFRLLPWQYQLIVRLFGWLDAKGNRKHRICYVEIPKKNGKSELAAALALYLFLADQEPGAEVYSAAADRDQAGLVFAEAAKMARANRALKKRCKIIDSTRRMVRHKTGSFYRVLSSDVKTKHGLSPHGVIFDELHAQPNRHLWDVLVEGTDTARRQQVILVLTTAGVYDKNSIAWQVHEKARQVRDGIIEDPAFLPIIFAAYPPAQDQQQRSDGRQWWEDPAVWRAANPSMGFIFDESKISQHMEEVKADPARLNNFLRFRLNVWVSQATRYLPMDGWDRCGALRFPSDDELRGRKCWGGLDLSSTTDLTAFALAWEPDEFGIIPVKVWPWLPGADIMDRSRRDNAPYELWQKAGHLAATGGNVVDYAFIRAQILEAAQVYNIQEIAYDPWNATQVALQLQDEDGLTMVEHRQGYKSMSPPTKELLRLVKDNKLAHNNHPVLRWCADNLMVTTDASENVKPAKDKSKNRIDGVVAVVNALGRLMLGGGGQQEISQGIVDLGAM